MKIALPQIPNASPELVQWIQDVTNLINQGFYQPRVLTARPTLSQMSTGEFAQGSGTGGAGEEELFAKVNSAEIAVFQTTTRITT